ncbi:MAG: response regulator [Phormidesmis sp.]
MIDDHWENRSVISNLIEPLGFEVIEAINGQEGLEKAKSHNPDVIITDINMPVMNGYEMMQHLRALTTPLKAVPIIVSSASVFATDQYKSFEAGANEFVSKPIQAESLFLAIQQQLGLEWTYEEANIQAESNDSSLMLSADIVLPPAEDLQALYDLSRRGLVKDLVEKAKSIQINQPECSGFIQPLLGFAQGFQLKQMRDFIEKHL